MEEVLTFHDLGSLVNILEDAKVEWVAIATQLGVPESEIQAIQANFSGNFSRCLREALVAWLKGVDPLPTRKCLVAALKAPSVRMEGLATKLLPPGCVLVIPGEPAALCAGTTLRHPYGSDVYCCIFGVLLAVVVGSFLLHAHLSTCFHGDSNFLPKRNQLIGREDEMRIVMGHLEQRTPRVDLVTLYGQAGFGKSEIAKHVGHNILKMCVDVYYILAEICADVECLEVKLMEISNLSHTHMRLEKWGQGLTRRTLLILDNVDGKAWIGDESRQQFQTKFLHPLLAQSSLLQVLITSQHNIQSSEQVFRSYRLPSLTRENCVTLMNAVSTTHGTGVSERESETLCDLVGYVPKAIKVLGASFSPENSVRFVIKTLNETSNKLGVVASNADFVDKDRLLSAIEIGFLSVQPKFQICSLLLVRFPGTFSLDLASSIITPDMMKGQNYSFTINECLRVLSAKSILEKISIENQLRERKERYHFHELITDYLDNFENKYNIAALLEHFWKNYVDWLSGDTGEVWLLEDLGKQDLDAMGRILRRNDHYAYVMAVGLCASGLGIEFINKGASMKSGLFEYWSERAPDWQDRITDILLSACEEPGFNYPFLSIDSLINAYVVVFEERVCDDPDEDCVDKLAACQPKIEELHSLAKGSHEAMEASSDYHDFLQAQCSYTASSHVICNSAWKYRLLRLAFKLVLVKRRCVEACQERQPKMLNAECRKISHLILGLESYSLLADHQAIAHLDIALEGDSTPDYAFHDSLAYITLYAIYSRQGRTREMKESLTGVIASLQLTTCTSHHWIFYDRELFAQFLMLAKEESLAKKLSGLELDFTVKDVGKEVMLKCQNGHKISHPLVKQSQLSSESSLSLGTFTPSKLKSFSDESSLLPLCGCPYLGADYVDYKCICFVTSENNIPL
jgi:hypothetical protein